MKLLGVILVLIVGIVCIGYGVIFITQASSSGKTIANEIAPLKTSEVDGKYDQVKAALKSATDPATVQSLTLQKTSLGLVKSNLSSVKFCQNVGIATLIVGLGFVLTAGAIFKTGSK